MPNLLLVKVLQSTYEQMVQKTTTKHTHTQNVSHCCFLFRLLIKYLQYDTMHVYKSKPHKSKELHLQVGLSF